MINNEISLLKRTLNSLIKKPSIKSKSAYDIAIWLLNEEIPRIEEHYKKVRIKKSNYKEDCEEYIKYFNEVRSKYSKRGSSNIGYNKAFLDKFATCMTNGNTLEDLKRTIDGGFADSFIGFEYKDKNYFIRDKVIDRYEDYKKEEPKKASKEKQSNHEDEETIRYYLKNGNRSYLTDILDYDEDLIASIEKTM